MILKRRYRYPLRCFQLLLLATLVVAGGLWWASQSVPDFYAERLEVAPAATIQSQLRNIEAALSEPGDWRIELTEEEVNAWLANDLLNQFPHTVPPYASDPRVCFGEDVVQIACQYKHEDLSAVLSVNARIAPLDQTNAVRIHVFDPKIGAVPGPDNMAVDQLRLAAARARLAVAWHDGEHPSADVMLSPGILGTNNQILITAITVQPGRILLSGTTHVVQPPTAEVQPVTHVDAQGPRLGKAGAR